MVAIDYHASVTLTLADLAQRASNGENTSPADALRILALLETIMRDTTYTDYEKLYGILCQ